MDDGRGRRCVLYLTDRVDRNGIADRMQEVFDGDVWVEAHVEQSARRRLKEVPGAVVVYDLTHGAEDAAGRVRRLREAAPQARVVAVTPPDGSQAALDCLRAGAVDCVAPDNLSRIVRSLAGAERERELRAESGRLKESLLEAKLRNPEAFSGILTQDERMAGLFMLLESIAVGPHTVLLTGETGTGKGLLAEALHRASGRQGRMVTVNAAGLDDTMFSDTLFGHARGAYTGAVDSRDGLLERAGAGTVFLDEIGDLSFASQLKLLRLLEEGEYYPLGADEPKRTSARFVVATNRDLASLLQEGSFRKDLYYRLSVHEVHVPPLRERPRDIPLLAERFLREAAAELRCRPPYLPPEFLDYLTGYSFAGNVRELKTLMTQALTRSADGRLTLEPVKEFIRAQQRLTGSCREEGHRHGPAEAEQRPPAPDGQVVFPEKLPTVQELRGLLIEEALRRAGGNQSLAAHLVGLTPSAVNKHLRGRRGGV